MVDNRAFLIAFKSASRVAAQINLELTASAPTLFSFRPISVAELQRAFIDYHKHVVRFSLATVSRYRTATQHLVNFCAGATASRQRPAHEVDVEAFVRYLRTNPGRSQWARSRPPPTAPR